MVDTEFRVITDENVCVSWGHNSVFGYYVIVTNEDLDHTDDAYLMLEKDTAIDGITRDELIDLVISYGVDPIYAENSLAL